MTIRTIKIPYSCFDEQFWAYSAQINKEQANIIRFAFNRYREGLKEKDIRVLLKSLNNISKDTWFQQSAIRAAASVAAAGLHSLQQINQGTKWTAWFNALKIDSSLYNESKYLQQWKQEDLCFGSVKELYNSVKKLFGSSESMSSSYHAFLGTYAQRRTNFKSEKSSVERIYVL